MVNSMTVVTRETPITWGKEANLELKICTIAYKKQKPYLRIQTNCLNKQVIIIVYNQMNILKMTIHMK